MDEQNGAMARPLLDDLLQRAKNLVNELEIFRNHLKSLRLETSVELAHFRGTVQSEVGMLERLAEKPSDEATTHIAKSSNLPFLETVWATAKKSRRLVALQKRVFYDSHKELNGLGKAMENAKLNDHQGRGRPHRNTAAVVDAITEEGRTWTKVSLITNNRLLFDLAKQGWECGSSGDDDSNSKFDDEGADVPLVKMAKELTKAAQAHRVKTKRPVVQLVLPRITEGDTDEIDNIIDQCRSLGAQVYCGQDLERIPDLESVLSAMAPDPLDSFSKTLNIDCTILLALVSEFSHAKVNKEPWFHTALQRQVDIEGSENLLPSLLYPAMADHPLVCTKEAAHRMREIVATIGTPSEKARTALLMGEDQDKSREQLVGEMAEWSAHPVPPHWQLPIVIVDQNEENCQLGLRAEAKAASKGMTEINSSVFLYGWASRMTTITSNRTVVKQIENSLEQYEDLEDDDWPSIWLCPTARSLVGKEKRGGRMRQKKPRD